MSSAARAELLARLLSDSRQMLDHAERGEWEQLASKDAQRREDLASFFATTADAAEVATIAEATRALLRMNGEIMAQLREARSAVMAQGRDYFRSRSAMDSYQAIDATP